MIKLVAVRNELETGANLLLGSRLGNKGKLGEQLTPSPPKKLWNGGMGDPDVPFILSKIVA